MINMARSASHATRRAARVVASNARVLVPELRPVLCRTDGLGCEQCQTDRCKPMLQWFADALNEAKNAVAIYPHKQRSASSRVAARVGTHRLKKTHQSMRPVDRG
jgi:hypothetical protein